MSSRGTALSPAVWLNTSIERTFPGNPGHAFHLERRPLTTEREVGGTLVVGLVAERSFALVPHMQLIRPHFLRFIPIR